MIKQIQFQNNYDAAKDANRTGAYVALRYDTEKKTLSVIDKFGEQKTNIIAADANEDRNIQKLKEQVVQLINKDDNFKQFLLQTVKETEENEKIKNNDYSDIPLTFKSRGNSKLIVTIADEEMAYDTFTGSYCYKINDGVILNCNKNQTFNLQDNDIISFYGSWNAFANSNSYYPPQIMFQIKEGDIDVFGNINSLQNFSKLFVNGAQNYVSLAKFKGVRDASKIILPPIVVQNCYIEMFKDCTSLIKAPILPGTIAPGCYREMFYKCTNLNLIEVNFTSWKIGIKTFTDSWVSKVAQEGTFIKPSQLPEEFGTSRIPRGWTVINKD